MDLMQISQMTGIATNFIKTAITSYQTFRRSNIEKYFEKLVKDNKDLTIISNNEELEGRFYYIIDQVAKERNRKKLEAWKNATISLATENVDYDEVDGQIRALEYLTHFDLTVLYKVYTTDFEQKSFEKDLMNFFSNKGVSKAYVMQSLRALAFHYLISEQYESTAIVSGGTANPQSFHYSKNDLGQDFLSFVFRNDRIIGDKE